MKRWSLWRAPDFAAVVEVADANDVATTVRCNHRASGFCSSAQVRFCVARNVSFSAQTTGHGDTSHLGNIKDGVQINPRRLNAVLMSPTGICVTGGGGVTSKELRDYLWKRGKQTVHGLCECVGLVASALGGGGGL